MKTLVVLAGGMGSRYGGLKQIDPVGPTGEVILEYSIFDALKAGFEKVVVVIKPEMEGDFVDVVGRRLSGVDLSFAYQELSGLPQGYGIPEGRVKPWGTAHAVLSAREHVDGPFAVINADDFYGRASYRAIADFLSSPSSDDARMRLAMVGYEIRNTVTDHGSVARGVCEVDGCGNLVTINERTRVEKEGDGARYTLDGGQTWISLPGDTPVSMNLWGFPVAFMDSVAEQFPTFLDQITENPLTSEFFLPSVVESLLAGGRTDVQVIPTPERWYGVTYREDKEYVAGAVARMHGEEVYPTPLWGEQ